MSKKLCALLLGLLSLGWAKVEVPINVGLGPSLFYMPGLDEQRTWHTGLHLDLYAVLDQELIRREAHRIPRQYRGLAKKQREIRIAPLWLALVPDALVLSPGDTLSLYGASWSLWGYGIALLDTKPSTLSLGLSLPSLSYLWVRKATRDEHLFGVGATAYISNEWRLSRHWLLEGRYRHTWNLPLSMSRYAGEGGDEYWWQYGEISVMAHYRFGIGM